MISNIFVFNSCYFPLNNQTAFWNRLKSSKDSRDLEKLKNCIFLLLLFYCLFWDLKVDLNVKLKWPDQTRSNRGSIANEEKWNWDNIVFTKTVFVFVRENQVFSFHPKVTLPAGDYMWHEYRIMSFISILLFQ